MEIVNPQDAVRERAPGEHIVQLGVGEAMGLRSWLGMPGGSLWLGRVCFEAVQGGGVLVRTLPYGGA